MHFVFLLRTIEWSASIKYNKVTLFWDRLATFLGGNEGSIASSKIGQGLSWLRSQESLLGSGLPRIELELTACKTSALLIALSFWSLDW